MREDREMEEEQRAVALVALDAVRGSQDEQGEVYEYRVRQDEQERVVEVQQVQVVERLCKAHRIRYSRNFFPERTAELRRRLFGQQDEEETSVDVVPDTRREDEKGEVSLVEQAPIEVPGAQESTVGGEMAERSASPVDCEAQTAHRSVWILCESAPFSDDVGEYRRRRRRALVASLTDLREGKRLYSRRVVSIWAYQRKQLRQAV